MSKTNIFKRERPGIVKSSLNNVVKCDRLSALPDDLIHKILSLVGMKHVVQTSLLSSRWRLIWTSMPHLDFSSNDFSDCYKFSNFVTKVLSGRNNLIETFSVNLTLGGKEFSQKDVMRIMAYAFSHNVQQMTITCLYGLYCWWKNKFPFSLFNRCPSLKHLTLIGNIKSASVMPPSISELPFLTTLDLKDVRFAGESTAGLLSKCVNLKSLALSNFDMALTNNNVTICHPQLSNLTLEDGTWRLLEYLHLVTPQLKNLTVINCDGELLISATELTTLKYKTHHNLQLFTDRLPSIQKVDLYIRNPHMRIARRIFGLLQKLHNVRNLTINLEIIEVLSSLEEAELISNQRPPLVNLKSFNIYPLDVKLARQAQNIFNTSPKLKSYLLDGSPNGTSMAALECIKALLTTESPASNQGKIQPCFFNLCAQGRVDTVMKKLQY